MGRLIAIVVNCRDTETLAAFWASALGREHGLRRWDDARGTTYVQLDGSDTDVAMLFQPVTDPTQGTRLHLDLAPPDGISQNNEVNRLSRLGAQVVSDDPTLPWVVMTDPEGNEFCVLPPRP